MSMPAPVHTGTHTTSSSKAPNTPHPHKHTYPTLTSPTVHVHNPTHNPHTPQVTYRQAPYTNTPYTPTYTIHTKLIHIYYKKIRQLQKTGFPFPELWLQFQGIRWLLVTSKANRHACAHIKHFLSIRNDCYSCLLSPSRATLTTDSSGPQSHLPAMLVVRSSGLASSFVWQHLYKK